MRSLSQIVILLCLITFQLYAQSPHGEKFDVDCSECHEPVNWKVKPGATQFDHSKTNFPLVGQHQLASCRSCHATLIFSAIKSDCVSCHTDIHKGTVGLDCSKCHSPESWIVKDINGLHQEGRFPLVGKHLIADCVQCHTGYLDLNFEPLGTDCYDCHASDYNSTSNPNHVSAGFSTDCYDCHSINAFDWTTVEVVHDFFPLVGGHNISNCFECHEEGGNFSGLSPECYSCHQNDYENTSDPNHVTGQFPTDCSQCHTIMGWTPATFDHNLTQFPLTGRHIPLDCSQCHSNGFAGTPVECYACHQSDYENTTDPNHIQAGFSTSCTDCHNTDGWDNATFDHNLTQFPLTGQHLTVDCSACHVSGYSGTPMECYACHQSDYENTTDPNHITQGFPTDCSQCHTTAGWEGANFDHSFYPISSDHNNVSCNECHSEPNFQPQCLSCHLDDFNEEHDPGDPTTCWDCHSTSNWDSGFNHSETNFPLTGAHTTLSCQQCHSGGYQGTPTECFACHEQNYNNTSNPNHQALMISTTCDECHSTEPGWSPALYPNHNQIFELIGAHASITNCDDCHQGNYNTTQNSCIGCHDANYNSTSNPPHQQFNFSEDCLECHNMNGWIPANFDHTFYPISTEHNGIACNECHSEPNYMEQCINCHLDDFNEEHNPGDPTDCWACHSTSNWDSNFDHNNTNFPLTGAHTSLTCQQCHSGGYQGTPTECFACHETNYNNTTNPNHQALMIATTCDDCHSTEPGWSPALYPQHNQVFELLGAHANISNCDDCHNGNYTSTPNTCMGCHSANYNGTNNPPHQTFNFSEDCLQCHNMNGWTPATFDHNFYPTGSNHLSLNCNECHSESNYQPQCLSCHLDDFNSEHNPGDPTDCWTCHSTSNWDSNFNHNNTNFPLTGAHIGLSCQACHESGYQGTPTECFACHDDNYNNTTNPDHQALILSTNCDECHTTNQGWSPALFPQHNQVFELLGAHASITNCDDCHNGNYVSTPNTCMGCHSTEYNSTNDPPHAILNFSQDCLECHTMNGWLPANFNHGFFPVSGDHNNVNCNQCHSEPNYQPQCLSCHMDDFLEEHNVGDPTDCWNCHDTFDWDDSPNPKSQIKFD